MNEVQKLGLIIGAPLQLGRKAYVCPALNIKGMRALKAELDLLQKGIPEASRDDHAAKEDFLSKLVLVAHTALVRNYPEITVDEIEEGIDFNNLKDVTLAVLGASGFKTTEQSAAEVNIFGKAGQDLKAGESTGTA